MHPVEHLIYFTRGVSACLVAAHHPTIFLFYNMRAMLGPAPGHHGFPGMGASHALRISSAQLVLTPSASGGSQYHWLHHAKFECNYGTSKVVPMDHIMGTYREE